MTCHRHAFAALRLAAAIFAGLVALPAGAQGCAGFADVLLSDPMCPSVEWVRNRGIARGCSATHYCPADVVTRVTMAAFLQRLGSALTPARVVAQESQGALELDVPVQVCVTADQAPVGYPRMAVLDGSFSALSATQRAFSLTWAWSTTGGATWNVPSDPLVRGGGVAGQWLSVPVLGSVPLDAGATVRFALRVAADAGAGPEAADSRCGLRVLLFSRDGATPPF